MAEGGAPYHGFGRINLSLIFSRLISLCLSFSLNTEAEEIFKLKLYGALNVFSTIRMTAAQLHREILVFRRRLLCLVSLLVV